MLQLFVLPYLPLAQHRPISDIVCHRMYQWRLVFHARQWRKQQQQQQQW